MRFIIFSRTLDSSIFSTNMSSLRATNMSSLRATNMSSLRDSSPRFINLFMPVERKVPGQARHDSKYTFGILRDFSCIDEILY